MVGSPELGRCRCVGVSQRLDFTVESAWVRTSQDYDIIINQRIEARFVPSNKGLEKTAEDSPGRVVDAAAEHGLPRPTTCPA